MGQAWILDWTAIAAFVAAGVSLIGTGVALHSSRRANRIAEKQLNVATELEIIKFREKWIDDVRAQMTELIFISSMPDDGFSFSAEEGDDRFISAMTRLLLLLPHDDKETVMFTDSIWRLRAMPKNPIDPNYDPSEAILLGKDILKREWDRLKDDLDEVRNSNAKNK